jgi:hypothetical protein
MADMGMTLISLDQLEAFCLTGLVGGKDDLDAIRSSGKPGADRVEAQRGYSQRSKKVSSVRPVTQR